MKHWGIGLFTTCAVLLVCTPKYAWAIDRDCPKKQVWDPNQGSCVKKKRVKRRSPAKKYYEALAHIEGTAKKPRPERGIALLQTACRERHAQSCTLLGFLHLNGRNVEQNAVTSLHFYSRSCKLRAPAGCLGAADIHARGLLGKVDQAAAIPFLDSACKLDSGKGCYELAGKYRQALGVPRNRVKSRALYKRAFTLLEAACSVDAGPSCHLLGLSYVNGRGTARSKSKAFSAFKRGCASGSGPACYEVGVAYRNGRGTTKDTSKALEFFDRACNQYDSALACHDAGVVIAKGGGSASSRSASENKKLLRYGERACSLDKRNCDVIAYLWATGVAGTKDQSKASHWYVIGCDHGSSAACQSAAHRAFDGTGMTKNTPLALKMWQKACDLGWADACADLGEHYYNGKVVERDLKRAYRLFDLGCLRGDKDACHWLGWVYHKGKTGSGKADGIRAVRFYKKACEMKYAAACIDLGHLYKKGAPKIAKSVKDALIWYEKACDLGHSKGCASVGDIYLAGELVPKDELAAGDAYARACVQGATKQCYWVDQLMRSGNADEAKRKHAFAHLEKACNEKKESSGCLALARIYAWGGYIGHKDGARAFALYDKNCKAGVKDACVQLGHMYSNGIGVVKDVERAKQLFTTQCNGAVPAACAWLGMRFYDEEKFDQAVPLFKRACDSDDPSGCTMYGYSLYAGKGVPWDAAKGIKLWQKGCKLGANQSCTNVGEAYRWGITVPIDYKKSLAMYQKGCTPTVAEGCSGVGWFYENGKVVEIDLDRAKIEYARECEETEAGGPCWRLADLLKRAGNAKPSETARLYQTALARLTKSANDNAYARYLLGKMYRDGVAVVRNANKALQYFSASCDGYDPVGCKAAGAMLMAGTGSSSPPDYEQAAVRFNRACAAGLGDSCEQAEVARKRMSGEGSNLPKTNKATETTKTKMPGTLKKKGGCACRAGDGSRPGGGSLLAALSLMLVCVHRRRPLEATDTAAHETSSRSRRR